MFYAIEIPHQMPAKIHRFEDRADFVPAAKNDGLRFFVVSLETLKADLEDGEEISEDAKKMANENGLVTEISWGDGIFFKPADTSEFDEAEGFLFQDAKSVLICENLEELKKRGLEYRGHQAAKVQALVELELELESVN
jgi:energy-coupling factor transporter ATP-binding protein EcfA2